MQNDLEPADDALAEKNANKMLFPIVGIGASAGGIGALEKLFESVPADVGMAFVIILHLDPTRDSIVSSMIQKHSRITVQDITSGITVAPNNAYMLPPNNDVRLEQGKLILEKPGAPRGLRLPIDYFFHSLANEQGEHAIGIILSGTGTDGTLGLKHIKASGGVVMVQEPRSTEYPGMPQSAISSIMVDYISTPEQLPGVLLNHVVSAAKGMKIKGNYTADKIEALLGQINDIVRDHSGQDFSVYKLSTVYRRLDRRMTVNQVNTLEDYITFLKENLGEVDSLFHEILIGVTHFFRDDEAFKALEEKVIPQIFEKRAADDPIRIWVAGCSTGEEAYSIAIMLEERNVKENRRVKVQIFATDIDGKAIEKARSGLYPENIAANITPDILDRYFVKQESMYRVKKSIRSMIVFARQNSLVDPPFSNIDLVSCRNLLIYLRPEVQKRLFEIFHYSLKNGGFLFLGTSEMITDFKEMFEDVDRKSKIFKKKYQTSHIVGTLGPYPPFVDYVPRTGTQLPGKKKAPSYREFVESLLLDYYCPSAAILNRNNEILYIHGRTGKYLEPAAGAAAMNILEMAREGLKIELATAIRKATSTNIIVRFENLKVKSNGDTTKINLIVHPIIQPDEMRGLLLIVFEEKGSEKSGAQSEVIQSVEDMDQLRSTQLESELASTKQYLQATVEELQTSNEELKSTNEELQSSNEELKSTNEELQTSQEELQSLNEELLTVNNELESKNTQLTKTNDDLNNLISSTEIATLFLDMNMNIKRFTTHAHQLFNLIPTDVGRPFAHISSNLDYKEYLKDIKVVLDTLVPVEKDVSITAENKWYTMRIIPYRTEENVIDGVVVIFVDITTRKETEFALQESEGKYHDAFNNAEFLKSLLMHDINNVLTVILMTISSLDKRAIQSADENLKAGYARIQEQVLRGANLVQKVRKIAEIQEHEDKAIPVKICDVIRETATYIQGSYPAGKVEFELNTMGKESITVFGSEYLGDALENIIINGLKYNTSEVKTIRIDVAEESVADSKVVKVSIADNGIGMPEKVRKLIINGTFRREQDDTRGLGIGLSIVKQIISQVGGHLAIENRVQGDYTKGTIVHVLLKAAK